MSSELRCARCNEYLFNGPVQCSCGDRLCTPCYTSLSKGKRFNCVKCKEEINAEECFKDRAATIKLKNTTLECMHAECSWKGSSEEYKIHTQKCTGLVVLCRHGCLGKQSPIYLPVPLHEEECPFAQCQWCNKTILKVQLDTHMRTYCRHRPTECEIRGKGCPMSEKLLPLISAVDKTEIAIQNLQEGFSELALMVQTLQATSYNGTFIWKIPEVQQRRHEAKIGKTISLYSAPFYTSRQGYKACLRLYMDGDGCNKNTHLSFFVTIMKGKYDALLQWPFRHSVTLTLLDQDGVKNISQAFQPELSSCSFQRPRNEMNAASGCPTFAPLSVLNNSSYVKEDTMFLKCNVSTV